MNELNQVNLPRDDFENIETAWKGDLWDRERLGIQLTSYVDRLQCGAVLALDARWGEGKTWFVRHWKMHLENPENQHNVIYLDAFANDYLQDPFLVISSEITSCLSKDDDIDKTHIDTFKKKAAAAYHALLPSLPKVLLTLGLNLISGGVLGTVFQEVHKAGEKVIDSVTEEIGDKIKESIEEKIESHEADKNTLLAFKNELAQLAQELDKPLVFIIDELDRCRPDFAIRLIERIKHFFDIPKIVFVLVIDKTQFSKIVCHNYGYDEKLGEQYLDKFIDFNVALNSLPPELQDNLKINIKNIFSALGIDLENENLNGCIEIIDFYIKDKGLSKRTIVKLASQFALLYTDTFDCYKNQLLIIFLLNQNFLLKVDSTSNLLKVLIDQIDSYIKLNESEFKIYNHQNYRPDSADSVLVRQANFFQEKLGISIFIQLTQNYDLIVSSPTTFSIAFLSNLRPTANEDFWSSWKNYIFGGI